VGRRDPDRCRARNRRTRRPAGVALKAMALACLGAMLGSCSRTVELEPPPAGVPVIRVLLSDDLEAAEVTIRGQYEILVVGDAREPRQIAAGSGLSSQSVRALGVDVLVDGIIRTPCSVRFVPERVPVEVNGRRYRGSLLVSPAGGRLRLINVLDLEGYLRGVVPCEMYTDWPPAALKAQAIAARTYALARIAERAEQSADVRPSVSDQVYGGLDKEDPRTTAAVAATAGLVLHYGHEPFLAYYSACCGGTTADAARELNDPTSPLHGALCGYCTKCPRYRWSFRISRSELARKLRQPKLKNLTLHDVGLDGRVGRVMLHLADGTAKRMSGVEFRRRVGTWRTLGRPAGMFSTRFTVKAEGSDFVFEGHGWGHGVGMCQWGAKGMADAHKTYREILENYYPGAVISKAYH